MGKTRTVNSVEPTARTLPGGHTGTKPSGMRLVHQSCHLNEVKDLAVRFFTSLLRNTLTGSDWLGEGGFVRLTRCELSNLPPATGAASITWALGGKSCHALPCLETLDHLLTVDLSPQPVPTGTEVRRNGSMDR